MKKISVIVPAYNAEKYIEKCLNSIVNNTYSNLQIICINDGSTDKTLSILEEYRMIDSRIEIINHKKNEGVSVSRNDALDIIEGEYVAFIDADDWIHPQYFEILSKEIENKNSDIVLCDFVRTKDKEIIFSNIESDNYRAHLILSPEECFSNDLIKYCIWGKLYRKTVIEHYRFIPNLRLSEDVIFNADILLNNREIRISKVDDIMYVYFDHSDSTVRIHTYEENYPSYNILFKKVVSAGKRCKYYNYYLIEIIKQALIMRYICILLKDKRYLKKINKLIYNCLQHARYNSLLELIVYRLFYHIPLFYRMWRIAMDPSMLIWEKNYRKKHMIK